MALHDKSESMNLTITIPNSIQILIYSYHLPHELFQLQTVSKYLFNLIKNNKFIWKHIKQLPYTWEKYSSFINLINNRISILDRGLKYLTTFRISYIKNDIGFDKLNICFPNLTALHLTLSTSKPIKAIPDQNLGTLLLSNGLINNLTSLTIQFSFYGPGEYLISIIPEFKNLTKLNTCLGKNKHFTTKWFNKLITSCTKLQTLYVEPSLGKESIPILKLALDQLKYLTEINLNPKLGFLWTDYMNVLGSHLQSSSLKTLIFTYPEFNNQITNEAIECLVQGGNLTSLTHLDLDHTHVSREGLNYLTQLPALNSFRMISVSPKDIQYQDWLKINNKLPNITKLETDAVSDVEIRHFVNIFPNVKILELNSCCLSSYGLDILFDGMKSLEYVQLDNFPENDKIAQLVAENIKDNNLDNFITCLPSDIIESVEPNIQHVRFYVAAEIQDWDKLDENKQDDLVEQRFQLIQAELEECGYGESLFTQLPKHRKLYLYQSVLMYWHYYSCYDLYTNQLNMPISTYYRKPYDGSFKALYEKGIKLFHQKLKQTLTRNSNYE